MVEPRLARAYGTLAGYGFVGLGLLLLPSTRLLEPVPPAEAYLLTLLGFVTGLVCLAVPWDLIDPRWLHLIGTAAIAETAATVAVFGQQYVAVFFLIGVLVAYIAPDTRTLVVQLALICAAVIGPVFYGPGDVRSSLALALVVVPMLIVTTSLFSYLRLKMVHDRRAYHRFAEQTLVLSSQIAGRQVGPLGLVSQPEPVPWLSRLRPPAGAVATCATLLGIPLLTGGLATAGVKLPDAASVPFERVGIELPNQEDVADGTEALQAEVERRSALRRPRSSAGDTGPAGKDRDADPSRRKRSGDGASQPDATRATSGAPVAAAAVPAPVLPAAPGVPVSVSGGGSGGGGSGGGSSGGGGGGGGRAVQDLLGEASQGLQGLLAQLQESSKKK